MKEEKKIKDNPEKKKNHFKKFLVCYIIILFILMLAFLAYVVNSLLTYENLQVENYLSATMKDIAVAAKKDKLDEYFDSSSIQLNQFEKNNLSTDKAIGNLLEKHQLDFKLNDNSVDLTNPIYDVYVDNNKFLTVTLNGENKLTKLAILTFQDWKLESVQLADDISTREFQIEVPDNYNVFVNDINLKDTDIKQEVEEGVNDFNHYANIPSVGIYKLDGFVGNPDIKITDQDDNKVDCQESDNKYKIDIDIEHIEDEESALEKVTGEINIEEVAKNWSLFLTNDLKGNQHGFNIISKYLIEDTYMWKYAKKWATDVDITFITSHLLDNPTFTNIKIDNFDIYNENAFSCEVYLEKNMILNKLRNKKMKDTMNERMYFVYYNNEWKLVNMQSVVNKNK